MTELRDAAQGIGLRASFFSENHRFLRDLVCNLVKFRLHCRQKLTAGQKPVGRKE